MPRPAAGYKTQDGEKVPGCTTITNLWPFNKGQLMHWAWNEGMEGRNYRDSSEKATTVGTIVHAIVEAELHHNPWPSVPPEHKDQVDKAVLGFYEWRDNSRLEVTESEVSLVSEVYRFGATLDHPARINGRRVILELKTSNDLYGDMLIQLAAQGVVWDEKRFEDQHQGFHLLRIGKDDGSFHHAYYPKGAPKMEVAWKAFLLLRELYDLKVHLK